MTLKVGLTGGIGSGKSIIAQAFSSLGIPIFFADEEAKNLINHEETLQAMIIEVFGNKSFKDNRYNTKYISEKVFNNQVLLQKLNEIVHPFVLKAFNAWCGLHLHCPYLIMEAAILVESGLYRMFDYLIVVSAPSDIRTERILRRDNTSTDKVKARMSMQLSEERKIKVADFVILNDNNHLVIPQILEIHYNFVSLQKN